MYIENWESFYQQAELLYKANPLRTRHSIKYRHCDGKLVIKVTDDNTCLQYRTDQQADLKKLEKLNALFLSLMATGEDPPEEACASKAAGGMSAHRNSQQPRQKG